MEFIYYSRQGRNAAWRYALATPICLALSALIGAIIAIVVQLFGFMPKDFSKIVLDASKPAPFFIANGAVFMVVLVAFVLGVRIVHAKRFRDIIGHWSWRAFLSGALVWSFGLVLAASLDLLLVPSGFSISIGTDTLALAGSALLGLSIQTFAEEFVFRGYLTQGLLLATKKPAAAALIAGALFGALHIPNGAPQAVSATAFGIILSWLAIRSGGIAFTYGLHLANNLFGAVIVSSADDAFRGAPALFTQRTPQLLWWDTFVGVLLLALLAASYGRWAARFSAAGLRSGLRPDEPTAP